MKKTLSILMAALICAGSLAGCTSSSPSNSTSVNSGSSTPVSNSTSSSTGSTGGESSTAPAEPSYDTEVTLEILRRGDVPNEPTARLLDDMLKEKFNMVWENSYVAANDMTTKMSTLFASGMEPDFVWSVRPEWGSDDWIEAGYFRGFTQEEILSLVPGYEDLWSRSFQEEGVFTGYMWDFLSRDDGTGTKKLYTLPSSRDTATLMAWMYRKDVFDKCGIDSFPTNPDEFVQVCRIIKEKMNITPLVDTNNNLFVVSKWGQMFGLPDLLPRMPTFKNPVTGEYYDYVYDSDTYRELVKMANTLVSEGLMYSEFATAKADQRDAYVALGNKAIMFDYPSNIAKSNKLQVDNVPDVDWQWTDVVPSIDPEKRAIKHDPYHNADLRAFAYSATDEQVERMCAYLQWSTTDEGITFNMFGNEGETYEVVNGKKQYLEKFSTPLKADGEDPKNYQLTSTYLWKGTDYIETYMPVLPELTEKILKNPKNVYVLEPVMVYESEEFSKQSELKTTLDEVVIRWLLMFMMGQKDPNNDAHWDEYKAELKSLGVDELRAIYKTVYERSGNEM